MLAGGLAALAACAKGAPPQANPEADQAAVKAVSIAWKQAYNAGDAAAVTALYAEDAVLSAPGTPVVLGKAAISDYFHKKVAQFSTGGFTVADEPIGEVRASGDLAWQWETYRVTDRSGALLDAGKLVTLFQRHNGQWLIAGDTWNSDAPPPAAAAQ